MFTYTPLKISKCTSEPKQQKEEEIYVLTSKEEIL